MTADPEEGNGIRATEESLAASQNLQSVVRLTAGAGHEFNNLIQTVLGSLQLINRLIAAGRYEETDKFVESAIQAARTAGELNQRLMRLAQPHALNPKLLAMNPLITEMTGLLRCLVPRSVTLTLDLASDLSQTHCDHHDAEIVLLNLVLIACDAIAGGGTITLRTRNCEIGSNGFPSINLLPGSYVLVEAAGKARGDSNELDDSRRGKNKVSSDVVRRFAIDNGGDATFDISTGRAAVAGLLLPRFEGSHT